MPEQSKVCCILRTVHWQDLSPTPRKSCAYFEVWIKSPYIAGRSRWYRPLFNHFRLGQFLFIPSFCLPHERPRKASFLSPPGDVLLFCFSTSNNSSTLLFLTSTYSTFDNFMKHSNFLETPKNNFFNSIFFGGGGNKGSCLVWDISCSFNKSTWSHKKSTWCWQHKVALGEAKEFLPSVGLLLQ